MFRALPLIIAVLLSPGITSAQQPCTSDERRIVDELYWQMFERAAGPGDNGMAQRLGSGNATVRDLVREIAASPDHTRRFYNGTGGNDAYYRAVGTLYRHLLGRAPDPEGARNFAQLAATRGFSDVVDAIVSSDEYQRGFGDYGVPGSGGLHYCAPNQAQSHRSASQAVDSARFRGMDANNDGQISQSEWRGNRQSFRVHDWNNDGVLSGDEVRSGSRRNDRSVGDENFDRDDRFDNLDHNNSGRIERSEWHGTIEAFDWLDRNRDGVLTRAEAADNGAGESATSRQAIVVDPKQRWTDTGFDVRGGDTVTLDAQGRVQLSNDSNDIAGPGGSTVAGRRAKSAPLSQRPAGALIARIGNANVEYVGTNVSMGRVSTSGRLFLGVNDDYLQDNSGEFRVRVNVR